jgi:hypothetical protein
MIDVGGVCVFITVFSIQYYRDCRTYSRGGTRAAEQISKIPGPDFRIYCGTSILCHGMLVQNLYHVFSTTPSNFCWARKSSTRWRLWPRGMRTACPRWRQRTIPSSLTLRSQQASAWCELSHTK